MLMIRMLLKKPIQLHNLLQHYNFRFQNFPLIDNFYLKSQYKRVIPHNLRLHNTILITYFLSLIFPNKMIDNFFKYHQIIRG